MRLLFERSNFEDDCKSIENILYLDPVYHDRAQQYLATLFQLDLDYIRGNNRERGTEYLRSALEEEYLHSQPIILEKINEISERWNSISDDVIRILSDIYQYSFAENHIVKAYFTMNHMGPYNYEEQTFNINYRKTLDEMIESCIHELIHFYWFRKWEQLFGDKYQENEHIVWKFSEIAIDAIFKKTELNKFCVKEKPAYQYFYDIQINGEDMIEVFRKLFEENDIAGFMEKGIQYMLDNKEQISD